MLAVAVQVEFGLDVYGDDVAPALLDFLQVAADFVFGFQFNDIHVPHYTLFVPGIKPAARRASTIV